MTDLNFKQIYPGRIDQEMGLNDVRMYALDPWPEECIITYYDFGSEPSIKVGSKTIFDWENGYAEYEALEEGLDVKCKLLPGSKWWPPPR